METEITKTEARFLDFVRTFAKEYAQGYISVIAITVCTLAALDAVEFVVAKIDSVRESRQKKSQTEN